MAMARKRRPFELALQAGHDQGAEHADAGRFGGRGEAAIHRAQHAQDQEHRRSQFLDRGEILGHRRDPHLALGGRHQRRLERGVDHDPGHEAAGQQEARDEAGGEQLGDRDIAQHAVDDHDVGGRDQKAQRARAGERADGDVLGIAALQQFGERDAADHLGRRRRRAGDGGEDRAADDVDVQQPARQQRRPRRQAAEQRLRQPGAEQDLAHQDEQRQRQQFLRGQDVPGVLRQQLVERDVAEQRQQDRAGDGQGPADPQAARQEGEQHHEHGDDDDQHGRSRPHAQRHSATAPARMLRSSSGRPSAAWKKRATNCTVSRTMPKVTKICGIHISVPLDTEVWPLSKLRQVK